MLRCYVIALLMILFYQFPAFAANQNESGKVQFAVKYDYIEFMDDVNESVGIDEDVYNGVEALYGLTNNVYLGVEIGYSTPEGDYTSGGVKFNTETTFIPIEINIKYSKFIYSDIYFDIGIGPAYIYIEEKVSASGFLTEEDDWLIGGQALLSLNYKLNNLFFGVNGKYQVTEQFKEDPNDYENWRIGGQIGMIF